MDEAQIKAIGDVTRKQMSGLGDLQGLDPDERAKKMQEAQKEAEKAIADLLKPEQAKHLKQVHLQQQGAQAFSNPDLAKDLKLTEEQNNKIKTLREDAEKEMRAGGRQGGDRHGGPPQDARSKQSQW